MHHLDGGSFSLFVAIRSPDPSQSMGLADLSRCWPLFSMPHFARLTYAIRSSKTWR